MKKRKRYTREFKLEAIRLSNQPDVTVAQVERELGLAKGMLYQWRGQDRQESEDAFPGKGKLSGEAARIQELERELERVRQERDILKKAMAYFAQEHLT